MKKQLIFVGAGALPETLHVIAEAGNLKDEPELLGVLDDDVALQGATICGVPVLGPLSTAPSYAEHIEFVFGIGSHRTRIERPEIMSKMQVAESRFASVIHRSAKILPGVHVGPGCIVHPGTIIGQDSVLEGFNLVFTNSIIASRNQLDRFAMITSLVALTDRVHVGYSAFVGTGAVIGEGVTIGAGASVSLGSVVQRDVPNGVSVMGNPAKPFGRTSLPIEFERYRDEVV